jgi:hypothetical protein
VRQVLRASPEAQLVLASKLEPKSKSQRAQEPKNHPLDIAAISEVLQLSTATRDEWLTFSGDTSWVTTAHRKDLATPRRPDDSFWLRLDRFVDLLGVILDSAEMGYTRVLSAIDDVVAKADPSPEDVAFICIHLAPGVTALAHVFGRLSVDWLPRLRAQGVFSDPPDIQRHDDGSTSFPYWPQAAYLARVASERPTDVLDVIESLPPVDNESIHVAYMQAGRSMPANCARRLALREADWLCADRRWVHDLLPRAALDLAVSLISQAEFDAAGTLLRATLSFEDSGRGHRTHPRLPQWTFDQVVHEGVRPLRLKAPRVGQALLCSLIDMGANGRSSLWRQAVEDHQQNMIGEPLDTLFVELRDLYEDRVRGEPSEVRAAVAELERDGRPLFDRLALHLLRRHGGAIPDLVVERACDQDRLDSIEIFHELAAMIEDQFPGLEHASQQRVVDAIRLHSSEERIASRPGVAGHDHAQHISRSTRRQLYALLGKSRPPEIEAEYQELCRGVGEPHHPTFTFWTEVRTGSTPPRTAAQLAILNDTDLFAFLRDWVPTTRDPFEASHRGLGRELKACASADPERFARIARTLRGLHPSYVTGILWGLHEGWLNAGGRPAEEGGIAVAEIQWDSVLDLIEWIVAQRSGREIEDWTSARNFAVQVLGDAFRLDSGVPDRRKRTWRLLQILLSDEDPSAERIAGNQMDDDTFVVNTVRGAALWKSLDVAFHLRDQPDQASLYYEILDELQRRTDLEVEPSYALRAVRARSFTTLFVLDPTRAIATASILFPSRATRSDERRRFWAVFLKENRPTIDVFGGLRAYYELAVDLLGDTPSEEAGDLGEHLTMLAAWNAFDFIQPDSPLARYVAGASAATRRTVLATVGGTLYRSREPLEAALVQRLRRLWEWWAQRTSHSSQREEVAAFGWWFASGVFDTEWSLTTLGEVMERTAGALDWDYGVAEKLAQIAESFPEKVAERLAVFVTRGTDTRINVCLPFIRRALTTLRARELPIAATTASRLVARGWDFRDLA